MKKTYFLVLLATIIYKKGTFLLPGLSGDKSLNLNIVSVPTIYLHWKKNKLSVIFHADFRNYTLLFYQNISMLSYKILNYKKVINYVYNGVTNCNISQKKAFWLLLQFS